MAGGAWQRTQVSDDGLRVAVIQVVDVHRRLNLSPVCRFAFFQDALHLFVDKTGQPRERRRKLSPIGDGAYRLDPDRSALKPPRTIKLIIGIPRCVAFRAFRYLLDEIASSAGLIIRSSGLRILRSAYDNGRSSAEKKSEGKNRPDNRSHIPLFSVVTVL